MKLDGIDCRILNELQRDGRLSNQQLADMVALSPSACFRRIKILEDKGFIDRYQAVLNPQKLGYEFEAVVQVSIDQSKINWHEEFIAYINQLEEVVKAQIVTGNCNYMLYVRTKSLADFSEFIVHRLHKASGINDLCSYVVLGTVKDNGDLMVSC